MLGFGDLLVVAAAVVIFFSARRLPELGASLGKTKRAFKGGLEGEDEARPVKDVTPKSGDPDGSEKDPGK